MELKDFAVGQKWKTNKGGVATVIDIDDSARYPLKVLYLGELDAMTTNGKYWYDSREDHDFELIELVSK